MAAKRKTKSRSLGEIKRTGRRRVQAQKAVTRVVGHGVRHLQIKVEAVVARDTRAIGSKREGDFAAEVCIPTKLSGRSAKDSAYHRRSRLKKGYSGRCAAGGGRTPTKALAAAFKRLGKNLE